jgi:hypothetical protein
MRRELWPGLLAILFLAQTASAQTPPAAAAAATSPTVSVASLLADGFEVKALNDISNDEQKAIWPTSPVLPYLMITLQKGSSIAVCSMAVVNWISLPESSVTDKTLCHKR